MTQQDNNFPEDNEEVVILLEDDDILAQDQAETAAGYVAASEPDLSDSVDTVPEEALGTEIVYEEDVYEEAPRLADPIADMDEKYDDSDEPGFMSFFNGKGVIIAGIALAVLILVAGVFLLLKKAPKEEPVDLSTLGNTVAAIGNIGEANINAITAAQSLRLEEINEAVKDYDYGEADLENGITAVNLSLTTILKDLKIKFTNSKNKLIAKVPFKVEVTDPSGKTYTWIDEDKDGIIYEADLEGGTYSVKLISLDGYDTMYDFTVNPAQSIAVKTQLDYQKVDVTNEIKKSSQASEKDDKATHDTAVESALKDTVAYVISAKVANSNGYAEIDKTAKIEDPILTITKKTEVKAPGYLVLALGRPVNTTDPGTGNTDPGNTDPGNTECANGTHSGTTFISHGDDGHQYKCDTCGQPYGEVVGHNLGSPTNTGDPSTHSKTCIDGCGYSTTESHTFSDAVSVDDTNHKKTCTGCGYELTEAHNNWTYTAKAGGKHDKKCGTCGYTVEETCEKGDDGNCKQCHQALTATVVVSLAIDKSTIYAGTDTSLGLAHVAQITPTVKSKKGTDEQTVSEYSATYESSDTNVLTVDQTGKITAVKTTKKGEAKATVTVTVKLSTGESGKATVEVTVKDPVVKLNYTTKKVAFIGGESLTVTATVTGHTQKDTVTWKSSDTSIATVTDKGVVTGLKAGTVTITAASVENPEVIQQLSVEVMVHPKNDTTTKLVDTAGKQVYVYDSSSKKYKEATYSDFYSGAKLYTAVDVTYKYTGWWTIDGKTYYYDSNGNKVTGDQVILGAKYSFDSDGALKKGSATLGIDVSTWNGNIDWDKVAKSGVSYAIIRCGFRGSTVGGLFEDNKFATNIKNATAAGLKVGVYFFTQAVTEAEAIEEASMCLSLVEGYKLDYPIFIDVEASGGRADGISKAQRTANVKAFCKTIENSKYKAGVYANSKWLSGQINTTELTGYKIWLAQYASTPTYTATRYDMWQYSSSGTISGISGNVDLNLSYLGY